MRALTVHPLQADRQTDGGLLLWKDGWMEDKSQWRDNTNRLMASPVNAQTSDFSWIGVKQLGMLG